MHGLSYIEKPTKRKKDVSGNKNTTAGYIEKKNERTFKWSVFINSTFNLQSH